MSKVTLAGPRYSNQVTNNPALGRAAAELRTIIDEAHAKIVALYDKLSGHGDFKVDALCRENGFSRDAFFDYMAGRHKKRISQRRRELIERTVVAEYGRHFAIELSSHISVR